MISLLEVRSPGKTALPHWESVFPRPVRWEFRPGLNILWGRNRSGKSSILSLLAVMLHAKQGGVSKVTTWGDGYSRPEYDPDHCRLVYDGQPIAYVDPSLSNGLIGGSFDSDFAAQGWRNARLKASHGETTLHRLDGVMRDWAGAKPLPAGPTIPPPSIPAGPKTLLLDEPDRSLDLDTQFQVWREGILRGPLSQHQIIVATHSPFATRVPGAHYIDLSPDYRELCDTLIWITRPNRAKVAP